MKRSNWFIVKLTLLIVLFFAIGIGAINFSGLTNKSNIDKKEKTFSSVDKLVMESTSLSVDIHESNVEKVTIKDHSKTRGLMARKPIKIIQTGGVVSVKQRKSGFFFTSVSGNIVVEIPKGSKLEYDVSTVSGHIDHDATSSSELKAKSISGKIGIQKSGEKVNVKTTSGAIKIYSPFEEIKGKSVSGSIFVAANQDSKKVNLSTVSDSIKIQLENRVGYTFNFSTKSGSVKDTYENKDYSKSGKATIKEPLVKIGASSISGSITLVDWMD